MKMNALQIFFRRSLSLSLSLLLLLLCAPLPFSFAQQPLEIVCPMPRVERVALRKLYDQLHFSNWLYGSTTSTATNSNLVAFGWPRIENSTWLDSTDPADDPCLGAWSMIACWYVLPPETQDDCTAGLATMIVGQRGITGSVPGSDVWSAFTGLRRLDFTSNSISGDASNTAVIFDNIVAWSAAGNPEYAVRTSQNMSIPRVPLLGAIVKLQNNLLNGTLPIDSINKCTPLFYVGFGGNRLSGDISDLFAYDAAHPRTYPFLAEIDMSNMLGGSATSFSGVLSNTWDQTLVAVRKLDLSNCNLEPQPLPSNLPTNIQVLVLDRNRFTGSIPDDWQYRLTSITDISLHTNQLEGDVPNFLAKANGLKTLLLNNNQLTGNPFTAICGNQTAGAAVRPLYYTLSNNQFSGVIPPCAGKTLPNLLSSSFGATYYSSYNSLQWSQNNFNNSLSDDSLSFLADSSVAPLIEVLEFAENNFTAPTGFASYWTKLTSLRTLKLSHNPLGFTFTPDPNAIVVSQKLGPRYPAVAGVNPGLLSALLAYVAPATNLSINALRTLPLLTTLECNSCMLRGNLFDFVQQVNGGATVVQWKRLLTLSLRDNDFVGNSVGSSLALITTITSLDISNNPRITGSLDALASLTFLTATGCPNLLWSGVLPLSLTYDTSGSKSSYIRDSKLEGFICPILTGVITPTTFQVDASYYQYAFCECDDGYMPVGARAGGVAPMSCVEIPYLNTMNQTNIPYGPAATGGISRTVTSSSSSAATPAAPAGANPAAPVPPAVPQFAHVTHEMFANPDVPAYNADWFNFTDAPFGTKRSMNGIDTRWLIDARPIASPDPALVMAPAKAISVRLILHESHFQGLYNSIEIFYGDVSLTGDRAAIVRGSDINKFLQLSTGLNSAPMSSPSSTASPTSGGAASTAPILIGQKHQVGSNTLQRLCSVSVLNADGLPLSEYEQFAVNLWSDSQCVYLTTIDVYSNQAAINFRSRDKADTHFFASYSLSTDCPSGYATADSTNDLLNSNIFDPSISSTAFYATDAFCAPLFDLSLALQVLVFILNAATIIACLIATGFIYRYQKHVVMKSASPLYLALLQVGVVLLCVSGILFSITPTDSNSSSSSRVTLCNARIWSLFCGATISLLAFDFKTERIRRIYAQGANSLQRNTFSERKMLLGFLIFLLLEIGLLLVMQELDLYTYQREFGQSYTAGYVVARCSSSSGMFGWVAAQIAILFLLLLWGGFNSLQIRKAAVAFKESQTAVVAVFLYCFFLVLLLPLQVLLTDNPNAQVLVMGLGLCVCGFLQSFASMSLKVYYIFTTRDKLAAVMFPAQQTRLSPPGEGSIIAGIKVKGIEEDTPVEGLKKPSSGNGTPHKPQHADGLVGTIGTVADSEPKKYKGTSDLPGNMAVVEPVFASPTSEEHVSHKASGATGNNNPGGVTSRTPNAVSLHGVGTDAESDGSATNAGVANISSIANGPFSRADTLPTPHYETSVAPENGDNNSIVAFRGELEGGGAADNGNVSLNPLSQANFSGMPYQRENRPGFDAQLLTMNEVSDLDMTIGRSR